MQHALQLLEIELQSLIRCANRIPEADSLNENDMRLLLLRNFFPILAVKHAFRWTNSEAVFRFDNGQNFALAELPTENRPLFNAIASLAAELQSVVDWDAQCFASLLVLQLLNTNWEGSSTAEKGFTDQSAIERLSSELEISFRLILYLRHLRQCAEGTHLHCSTAVQTIKDHSTNAEVPALPRTGSPMRASERQPWLQHVGHSYCTPQRVLQPATHHFPADEVHWTGGAPAYGDGTVNKSA